MSKVNKFFTQMQAAYSDIAVVVAEDLAAYVEEAKGKIESLAVKDVFLSAWARALDAQAEVLLPTVLKSLTIEDLVDKERKKRDKAMSDKEKSALGIAFSEFVADVARICASNVSVGNAYAVTLAVDSVVSIFYKTDIKFDPSVFKQVARGTMEKFINVMAAHAARLGAPSSSVRAKAADPSFEDNGQAIADAIYQLLAVYGEKYAALSDKLSETL